MHKVWGFNRENIFVKISNEKRILEIRAEYFKEVLNPLHKGIISEEKVYFGPQCDIRDPFVQKVSAS